MAEDEVLVILWDAIMASEDWSSRIDQIENSIVKLVAQWAHVLESISSSPKSQLALINRAQMHCHEDSRFVKHFSVTVQQLYKNDVVSESACLYWFEKGAIAQGKSVLVAQMEPFCKWLSEQESDDEDEE